MIEAKKRKKTAPERGQQSFSLMMKRQIQIVFSMFHTKALLLRLINKYSNMKNYIPATFLLTLIVVGVLMGLYFLPSMSVGGKPLRKVDLLADIRPNNPQYR